MLETTRKGPDPELIVKSIELELTHDVNWKRVDSRIAMLKQENGFARLNIKDEEELFTVKLGVVPGHRHYEDIKRRYFTSRIDDEGPVRDSRRPTKEEQANKVDNVIKVRGGTSADYLARKLMRDAPETYEAFKSGAYKSVRDAAIAGGLKVPERRNRDPYLAKDEYVAAERLIDVFGHEWCRDLHRALGEQLK